MKTTLAPGNDHPSRSGRVATASVMRRRDLIITPTMRTGALTVVQSLSIAERLMGSPREGGLNPPEVVPKLHATAIRAGLITTLRGGRSKTNAGSVGAREDMKAGKKIQTSMDMKAVWGLINIGDRVLALAPVENTEQG